MPTAPADVALLLRRCGYRATPQEVAARTSLDLPAIVDAILDTSAPADAPPAEIGDDSVDTWLQVQALTHWWLDRMATSSSPLVEKLSLMWHSHFATSAEKAYDGRWLYDQNHLFRANALGSFRTLCQAVAIGPAMLEYLDNRQNSKGAPQENFARELMELFTVGVGQYTQADVVASARAWTGHTIDDDTNTYVFKAGRHDTGQKTFMGVTKNWNGPDIIDHLTTGTRATATARNVAKKAWAWFVSATPPPAAVLDDLAAAFAGSDLSIRALLRALLLRPELYASGGRQGLLRSPVEYVIGLLRATGLASADAHPEWFLEDMGMVPFYPPDVSGFRMGRAWTSTSTAWARADFARSCAWIMGDAFIGGTETLTVHDAVQKAFDSAGITSPMAVTRTALETWLTAERAGEGWAERPNLTTLVFLTPDFNVA